MVSFLGTLNFTDRACAPELLAAVPPPGEIEGEAHHEHEDDGAEPQQTYEDHSVDE
jgi:hypothetical protein